MKKFVVTIEEHIVKDFTIEAADIEEAMGLTEKKYKNGEIVLDGDSQVNAKLMMAHDPTTLIYTDWVEF